jgi:hypothetical protein
VTTEKGRAMHDDTSIPAYLFFQSVLDDPAGYLRRDSPILPPGLRFDARDSGGAAAV